MTWATVYRCASCKLLFQPERTAADVHDLYDEGYFTEYPGGGAYDEDERARRYESSVRLRFVHGFVRAGRLLEIGAATGHFLAAARDAGFDVMGVEPSAHAAQRARERYGVDVIAGFAEDVDLERHSFDVVCAWHVIEHVPDPLVALRRLATTVRPRGALLLEVPNVQSVQAQRLGDRWPHLDVAHHVAHYGPDPMRRLLERAGFQVIHTETFPGTGYFPPAMMLRPLMLAACLREALQLRAVPRRSHPSKHELLRMVARAPEAQV